MGKRITKENQGIELKFKFDSYKVLKFKYDEPPLREIQPEKEDFRIDWRSGIRIMADKNLMAVRIGTTIFTKEDDPPIEISDNEIEYFFEIEGLNSFPKIKDGLYLPEQFIITLISLSISTTRGFLLAKGAGTILGKIILPVINPKLLLPGPHSVKEMVVNKTNR